MTFDRNAYNRARYAAAKARAEAGPPPRPPSNTPLPRRCSQCNAPVDFLPAPGSYVDPKTGTIHYCKT